MLPKLSTLFALILMATSARAAGVVIGAPADPGGSNCFPFGCAWGNRYQQMYSASAFSGPISITSITFFNTQHTPASILDGTYTFRLSTSPLTVTTIDTTSFGANIGADEALFAVTFLTGSAFPSFTVNGTPFDYDPGKGDLLLDIWVAHVSPGAVSGLYNDARFGTGTGIISRFHNFGGGFEGIGLVTGFNVTSVPEPTTLISIPFTLGGMIFLRRRR